MQHFEQRFRNLHLSDDITNYAIGDVHGHFDHLLKALEWCYEDSNANGKLGCVHLLGDYIDRGPSSRQVLEFLIENQHYKGMPLFPIRGNHDHVLMCAYLQPDHEETYSWWTHGGQQTLMSYGWNANEHSVPGLLEEWIPSHHIEFIRNLPLANIVGDKVFVHAGIMPGIPLEEQTDRDLMWVRGPFNNFKGELPFTVIHGHTPDAKGPTINNKKVCVDTGCFYSGVLGVAAFDANSDTPRFARIKLNEDKRELDDEKTDHFELVHPSM